MKVNIKKIVSTALLSTIIISPVFAGDVNLHGFIRSAYDQSNSTAKYLETIDQTGDFGGTDVGLTYSTSMNTEWSIAGQLFFKAGEGVLQFDWAFATFTPSETTAIRFGRQKYPLGLISESIDIGITYPWIRAPEEMYTGELGGESGNFVIENFDGVSLVYTTGDDWEISVQPFVGQHDYKFTTSNNLRKILGVRIQAEGESVTLQGGYMNSDINVTGDLTAEKKTTINGGIKVEIDDFLAYAEYAKTEVSNSDTYDTNAAYMTLAYGIGKHQPSITVAELVGQKAAGAANGKLDQKSIAVALSYHYNPSTTFKVQWKNVKPGDPTTGGLIAALPTGKTSVDIVSFAMDVVF